MAVASDIAEISHRSKHGEWTLWRRGPPPQLRGQVLDMEGYVETGGQPLTRRELPFAGVPLILVFEHHFSIFGDLPTETARLSRSFIAGLTDRPTLVGSPGCAFCMQVNFTALGAWQLLGIDMHEITGRVLAADELLGPQFGGLEDRLAHARGWPERFAVLEDWIVQRIARAAPPSPLVDAAYARLLATGGAMDIGRLARGLEVSRKHLNTLFRRELGLGPKAMARVLRFEHAFELLQRRPAASLADLAYACGYADQSHFTSEFRAMAGAPPMALLRSSLPDGSLVAAAR